MSDLRPILPPPDPPADPWDGLRAFTAARIALGRTGSSVPLREALAFRLAHAHARDAVYSELETGRLLAALEAFQLPVVPVRSQAENRPHYLQRPDLGRVLHEDSRRALKEIAPAAADVAIILADGLSATALNQHALPLLNLLLPQLREAGFRIAPLTLAEHARVALSDEIGSRLHARLALILLGERPGLSAPDSLGAYFTYAPRPGRTDEARNCVSNIRPAGLPYEAAADKLFLLVQEALRRQLSGVALKDETGLLGQ
ncbi:ethanolamine ammonia-lyase subunit EutC [Hymenobacter chitinivorans]|uniref:Ethanolamine ammonia-lyase small subunit n=1 Tax=Hymenobacter chitinivorans DSM 11115 TaxID=1121954 RepID=A0A2M9BRI1_9BACT|nr:ethanolamine ammonia-lyase subunit EutC [Hymenobacter chitinivorans]PJJ60553.1 ethanolamine ammonia-lyase small subunit [Hymenobacter chitinivorans DSM 11115]